MKKTWLLFEILVCFIFLSCNELQKRQNEKIFSEWIGKEIIIPDVFTFKSFGKDTLCNYLWDKEYKIFTYIDSIGCSSCKMDLQGWEGIIKISHKLHLNIGFIFVVHSSNFWLFDTGILIHEFEHPIIYDYNNDFHKLNNFPPAPFRTFLLDKSNKVLLIGSPVGNPEMWEEYLRVITQKY